MLAKTRAAYIYGKGCGYFIKRKYKKAIEFIEKSHELDPESINNSWHTYSVLGRSYMALGDVEKAKRLIKKAIEMFGEDVQDNQSDFDKSEYKLTLMAYDILENKVNTDDSV